MAKKQRRDQIKKPRSLQAAPPVQDLDEVEVEEGAEEKVVEKIELFKYKGKTYYMAEPDATMMLKLLETAAERGEMAAVGVMLKELIGDDTYRVLKGIPNLSGKELNGVIERVMHFSMDRMDEVLGN